VNEPDPAQQADQPDQPEQLSADERRRRRERVFGEVLPDRTRDEQADPHEGGDRSGDEWLRRQVPPHHG
jgi:hypothetical protein